MTFKELRGNNIFGAIVFVLIALLIVAAVLIKNRTPVENRPYKEFMAAVEQGRVEEVILTEDALFKYRLSGQTSFVTTDNPHRDSLKEELLLRGINVSEGSLVTGKNAVSTGLSALFFVAVLVFVYRTANRSQTKPAMALSMADQAQSSVHYLKFDDIAGNEEAKEQVTDIVDFIKNPEKYERYGARMPHGVIFYGPPGTGKTLMAKAIAGEADSPFYAVSGSDFVQMYVGVGAGRIRELFQKARENKKAVIFIDEIDAMGKKRASGAHDSNDEREQTLNALLSEMSGFSSGDGIIVIAATNRLDTIDEALLRPGRFDRQVEIGLPDYNARKEILSLHMKNKPLGDNVDLEALAKQTVYFSGAMLENLLNEAAINAARRCESVTAKAKIAPDDIDKAYYTVVAGSEKKDRSNIKQREREITAYHESGHALAAKILSPENTVAKVTIIPSARGAGGFCVNIPPDKMYYTKQEIESQIMINFAGRVSEELIFGEDKITTGASNDIEKCVSLATDYINKFAMGKSFLREGQDSKKQISELLESMYERTKDLLRENMGIINKIAEQLLAKESLNEDEIDRIIELEKKAA
ncbi:MAG: AAA family ATPase [Clostridiales bacterium]|nr:AAA family ATPase [Clostridiales bacterium]